MDDEALATLQQEIVSQLNWQGPVYAISALSKIGTEKLAFDIMQQLEIDRELEREQEQLEENNQEQK